MEPWKGGGCEEERERGAGGSLRTTGQCAEKTKGEVGGLDGKSNIFLGFMAGHCLFTLLNEYTVFFLVALFKKTDQYSQFKNKTSEDYFP